MERPQKQRNVWLICLVLALVTFSLYVPMLHHDFVNFDDETYVAENSFVQNGLTPASIAWAFTSGRASNWHPLTWISHMVDFQLYGVKHPGGHHLTSLLFHIANTLLLFIVLRRMTGAVWRSAVVAALFAWHPLHVESIAWVAERKDVLSAFFWLLTMLAYVRYVELSKGDKEKSKFTYGLTLLFFTLGLLSKPMVVTLPFVLLLLDIWPLERLSGKFFAALPSIHPLAPDAREATCLPSSLASKKTFPQLILEKLPFFLLAAISSVVTFLVQQAGGAVKTTESVPLAARLINALMAYAIYLEKTFWPSRLAVFYPLRSHWSIFQVVLVALLLAFISLVAIRGARSRPWLLFGWLWFLGTLVPVIGLVQVGSQSMADRYSYLPLVGIFMATVWEIADAAGRGGRVASRFAWAFLAFALLFCLPLTRTQLAYWKNTETLFRHDLDVTSDNSTAHFNLGRALDEAGHADEAGAEFATALRANPAAPLALVGMGRHYAQHGDDASAVKYYTAALRASPSYGDAHYNLANLLARDGKYPEAAAHFADALRADPDAADAHNNLGAVLMRLGRPEEAVAQFREALRLKPHFPEAQDQLGSVLLYLGHAEEAEVHFAEAVRLKPDFVHARIKLGVLLAQHGDLSEAISNLQSVLKTEPQNADATYNLGAVYVAQNQFDDAAQMFALTAQLRPNDPDPRIRQAAVLVAQGKFEMAKGFYEEALKLKPDAPEALKGLAWIYGTAPKPELRNGAEAVKLAERADALTGHKQAAVLSALDAAYAEAGRFEEAIKTAEEGEKLALAENRKGIADQTARRLELYRVGKPFHQ